jgi:pimeloyl-ACP methyl ester carboxylesterase
LGRPPSRGDSLGKCPAVGSGSLRRAEYRLPFDHARSALPSSMLKTFAGGRLFGASFGEGRPWVLALPGWTRTHRDFDDLLANYDAISVDLPGFGAAPPPPDAWSTAAYAAYVAPVLDDLAPGAVVLGHSFGGRVAVHLGATHPDRVGALVLTGVPLLRNPAARPPRSPLAFRMGKALQRRGLLGEARIEGMRKRYGSADYRAASGVMRDVLVKAVNETYEAPLAAFPGPIELVWGTEDDQAPIAVAEAALAISARATLTRCPGVGHFVPQQAPDVLRAALERHRPPDDQG